MTPSFKEALQRVFQKARGNYFAKASVIFILSSMILKGFSLITTPIFTRLLTQEQYGEVTTVITYSAFLAVVIFMSVSASIATARIHYTALPLRQYTANTLLLGIGIAAVVTGLVWIFRGVICDWLQISERLFVPVVIFALGTAVQDTVIAYLVASKMPKAKLVYSLVTTLMNLLLGLAFVLFLPGDRGDSRILSISVTYVVSILAAAVYFFRFLNRDCARNIKTSWGYALRYGSPLLLHLISGRFITMSGRAFIAAMCSKSDVAVYSVVYSIGHLGNVFTQACNSAWSPWYFDRTKEKSHAIVNKYARIYICALSLVFVGIILFARELLMIIAPADYAGGEPLIGIVAIGVFFQLLYSFPALYEQYSRQIKWQGFGTMIAAGISLLMNFLLIRPWGITGAALASAIAYAALFVLHEVVARRVVRGYNIRFSVYAVPMLAVAATFLYARFTADSFVLRLVFLPVVVGFMGITLLKYLKKKGN